MTLGGSAWERLGAPRIFFVKIFFLFYYITVFPFIFSLFLFTFFSIIECRAVVFQPPQSIILDILLLLVSRVSLSEQSIPKAMNGWYDAQLMFAGVSRNRGSVDSMQCDETFFSVRKRHRGSHGAKRVRDDGTEVAQTIAVTTRTNKLSQIFMEVIPDRKASTLSPRFEDLACGGGLEFGPMGRDTTSAMVNVISGKV